MPSKISLLWFAIIAGIVLTGILIMLMYTRKRLALVLQVIQASERDQSNARMTVLERKIQTIFDLINRRLAAMLHAPHLPAMDRLLHKVKDGTIIPEEAVTLYTMLIERREELIVEGLSRPDLDFPELFVMWSLEVTIAHAGLEIPRPQLSAGPRPPPTPARGGGSEEAR